MIVEIIPAEPHPLRKDLFGALVPAGARDEFRDALRYWEDPGTP